MERKKPQKSLPRARMSLALMSPRRPVVPEILHGEEGERTVEKGFAMLKVPQPVRVVPDIGALGAYYGLEVRAKSGQVELCAAWVQGGGRSADREAHSHGCSAGAGVEGVLDGLANEALGEVGAEELALNGVLVGLRRGHRAEAPVWGGGHDDRMVIGGSRGMG